MKNKYYDVPKFVYHYFPDAKLSSDSREFLVACPWHEGHKRKLYISAEQGMYNCFSCGVHGSFFSLVKRVLATMKTKQLNDFIKQYETSTPMVYLNDEVRPISGEGMLIDYPENFYSLCDYSLLGLQGKEALDYLIHRGLSQAEIAYYKIGYCLGGKYDKRIIIPVFKSNDELVSFVARDFSGFAKAKVLTPAALPGTSGIKDYIFNLQNAVYTKELLIGEGVFDAIALGKSGVAIFGKQATEKQVAQILLAKPLRIVVCLDYDAPNEKEALALRLSTYHSNVYVANLPYGDPASVSKSELDISLKTAVKFNTFAKVI